MPNTIQVILEENHRGIEPNFAIPSLRNGTPIIERFLAQEWITFNQANPRHQLTEATQLRVNEPLYSFDRLYARHTFQCLIRVIRLVQCLLHDDCPMVQVAGGKSFQESIIRHRASKVGYLPSIIPNPNLDSEAHNPLTGCYTRNEALDRANDVNRLGVILANFLSDAYDKFGPGSEPYEDPEDPDFAWDFERLFAQGTDNGYLNGSHTGNSLAVTRSLWNGFKECNNTYLRNCFQTTVNHQFTNDESSDSNSEDDELLSESQVSHPPITVLSDDSPKFSPLGIFTPSDNDSCQYMEEEPIVNKFIHDITKVYPDIANRPPTPYPNMSSARVHFTQADPEPTDSPSNNTKEVPVEEKEDKLEELVQFIYDKTAEETLDKVKSIMGIKSTSSFNNSNYDYSKSFTDPKDSNSTGNHSMVAGPSNNNKKARYSPYARK